jgi:hypothetical protein
MSTDSVSPLRQRMIEDMNARKLCAGTQRGHIRGCKRFAAFLKRSPDTATSEDIRRFQLHLAESGASICNRNRIMTNETSGPPGIIEIDGHHQYTAAHAVAKTIADQLTAARLTWKTYQESLPLTGADSIGTSDGFFTDRTVFGA